MNEYDIAKIIADIIKYQQNDIDTYRIIVLIETLVIIFLTIELVN